MTLDQTGDRFRWRNSSQNGPSRMHRLFQRQKILNAIRDYFYSEGFLEAETPLWVKGTCPDRFIDSVPIRVSNQDGYLVTSTEYQIKRMIVGGFEKVFTLTKNFRAGDRGQYHSSEFTMLEWARVDQPLDRIEEDTVRFIQSAFQRLYPGQIEMTYLGAEIEIMETPWQRLTVREAMKMHLGMDDLGDFSLEKLIQSADQAGIQLPENFRNNRDLTLSFLLDRLQSHLGRKTPTFLREWPAFMTSSAQLSSKDPYAAERSELYIAGVEISDGFPFLRDPDLQRLFFERELHHRVEEGKEPVVLDERYLKALEEGLPSGAGMALGVDRLVMVLTGASGLSEVQAFNWDEL